MIIVNPDRTDTLINALITLWKASVRATHHFLTENDIQKLTSFVKMGLSNIETLVVTYDEQKPIAFMGIETNKIEMLFVSLTHFGKGIGRELAELAISRYRVRYVDVNEQNPQAIGFYQHIGFEVIGRTKFDEQGNPFPILKMKRYIETARLILRHWQEKDIPHLARLNSDEKVMEYFLKKLSYKETIDFYKKMQDEFIAYGFGAYAVEEKDTGAFIGFVGLHNVTFNVDFAPAVEILWRLLPDSWGKGYATEAAMACLNNAKDELELKEIISFTSLPNKRSEQVMQRIGMTRVKEFDHPLVEPDHPLYRHVLYKINLATLEK